MRWYRRIPSWHQPRLRYFLNLLEWELRRRGWYIIAEIYEPHTKDLFIYAREKAQYPLDEYGIYFRAFTEVKKGDIFIHRAALARFPVRKLTGVYFLAIVAEDKYILHDFGGKRARSISIMELREMLEKPWMSITHITVEFPAWKEMFCFLSAFPAFYYDDLAVRKMITLLR